MARLRRLGRLAATTGAPAASAAWAWRRRRWPGLRDKGVQVHVLETAAAIELYNELGRDQAVGGLFHSTC